MKLVLASASPRRRELLRNAGLNFFVEPAQVPENQLPGESPIEFAGRMARDKARAIHANHAHDLVLGADTIVVVAGEVLGKPRDAADADRMLHLLSGRSHEVITGVCLISPASLATGNRELATALPTTDNQQLATALEDVRSETTQVTMATLTDDEIRDYISTGEPMGKAGAYAIQGVASRWISSISGCYFNVVGLPVPLVYRMLREHGFENSVA